MIKTLKRRFIILAMISLTLLLAAIVTGMNIINYNKVVSDADARLDVLGKKDFFMGDRFQDMFDYFENNSEGTGDNFGLFERRNPGGPRMSMDEAEESRFFTVIVSEDGTADQIYTDRISAVDNEEAAEYAEKVMKSGSERGFEDELRYCVSKEDERIKITFLDCGRVLASYRDFLRASIMMSLAGLLAVFFIILYFAGRIVRPVAESYEKQKRFITDAGHEIKTPLAIIKANIDLMDMELDSAGNDGIGKDGTEEIKGDLAEINNQVDRLTGLTNDLVFLSRMEESSAPVMSDIPFSDILNDSVASFSAPAREKNIEIKADIESPLFTRGSTAETEKLISILMENAVKYSVNDSDIIVNLKTNGKNAELKIKNNVAEKLDPDSLSHVFERFYRTDSSRNSQTGGHGIGLSMAKAIVDSFGGAINAVTKDGSDFIIIVTLPLA